MTQPQWKPFETMVQERKEKSRNFVRDAEREFAAGDNMQASEKLGGAAAHAIMAVAQERGWAFGNHRVMINCARRVAGELDDDGLRAGLAAAQLFHSNFYHDHMEEEDLEPNAQLVRRFVDKMLALVE